MGSQDKQLASELDGVREGNLGTTGKYVSGGKWRARAASQKSSRFCPVSVKDKTKAFIPARKEACGLECDCSELAEACRGRALGVLSVELATLGCALRRSLLGHVEKSWQCL